MKPLLPAAEMERLTEAFPILDAEEREIARECGTVESLESGQCLFQAGQQPVDFFVVASGSLEIIDTSGDEERLVVTHHVGSITGDLNLFAGRPAVVTCRAVSASEVIRLTHSDLRHLLVRASCLGEKWMTAFLSRAELLDNTAFEGLRVFGGHNDQATLHVREFLHRNGIPHHWIDIDDPANAALVAAIDGSNGKAPVVAWGAKILLRNPSLHELAAKVGVQRTIPKEPFDTVIIGGGPAGLGAAVYAASEGLHTVVLDRIGPGGQAGASSRIENYAGFPSGLSGRDLALRSYLQALKFGAVFSAPVNVRELRCAGGDLHEVVTDEGEVVRTRTIIIAAGVSYRTLGVRGLNQLRGAGVYFSATQVEAMLCRAGPVHIIGAGNSAGQAAMYLSRFTDRVRLIVRGGNIRKGMSSYLAERVEVNPHIDIRLHSELRAVEGSGCLERVHIENTAAGQTSVEDSVGVFIFIGATPCTDFLGSAIRRDEKGYIVTGAEVSAAGAWPAQDRQPCALETSCPGVFAAGDCRSRTTKRVAFAVGDGALAVTCVHDFLGTYD